jgi:histidinol-phosphate/aromatic aminotransferase/cobyric acid decarboxylase-like protein
MSEYCLHGGDIYQVIGDDFRHLHRATDTLAADVLDAWYPPSPRVLRCLREHLSWAGRTSPPLRGQGLKRVVADTFGIPAEQVVLGNGSSDLIFRLLPEIFRHDGPVVIPAPSYGEYAHVLQRLCGRRVRYFPTYDTSFRIDPEALIRALEQWGAGGLILINPCNPTGQCLSTTDVRFILETIRGRIPCLIDETYFAYMPEQDGSMQAAVAQHPNLVILRSLSKVYALSGLRVGYALVSSNHAQALQERTPPYTVSTLAQMAAIEALRDQAYATRMVRATQERRAQLREDLRRISGLRVVDSHINSLLLDLADCPIDATELLRRLAADGILLRDISSQGDRYPGRFVRISVLDYPANTRMAERLRAHLPLAVSAP